MVSCATSCALHGEGWRADLVLTNAKIYTVNPKQPWADTLTIKEGVISYVGHKEHFEGEAGRTVDLRGKMILPGFQDIHIHPVHSGVSYQQCVLFDLKGLDSILSSIADCAKEHPEWEWIRGGGWEVPTFAPSGLPDKVHLDRIIPNRPVALKSSDGHSMWVNSLALELAGINADTPDPKGGRIDRYQGTFEPSGGLQEDSAMDLLHAVEPPLSQDDMVAGLRYAQSHLNSLGITAVQDAIVKLDGKDAYKGFPAYHQLDDAGELNMHVVAAMYWENERPIDPQVDRFIRARKTHSRGNIKATSIKIWQDGVIETQTAALLAPYLNSKNEFRGKLLNNQSRLNEAVRKLDKAGFQVHFHAIGDAAIRSGLDAIEHARDTNGIRDARHHLSHIELFHPDDIPRFKALDVVANFQPLWAINDSYITDLTVPRIGIERAKYLYPIGTLLRSGARVAFGSDWYVTSANPLLGIEAAITRLEPYGATDQPLGDDEEITLAEAIAAYTIGGAYVNFLDKTTGSLEVGKQADLIVLDQNLFEIPASEISDTDVVATIFQGRLVAGEL